MKKILLLSSERSGSNLLRKLFGASEDIDAPAAAQFLKAFMPYEHQLNISESRAQREKIVELAISLVETHPVPWQNIPTKDDLNEFIEKDDWNILNLFDALYSFHARENNKNGYFVKENNIFDFADKIYECLDDVYYIYLARDPRDVYLSFTKVPGGPKTPYHGGKLWSKEQQKCISILNSKKIENVMLVKYEDLITEPEKTIKKCYEFTKLSYTPGIVEELSNQKGIKTPFMVNLNKGIMADNMNKFKKELSESDIEMIETLAKKEMQFLQYKLTTDANADISSPKQYKMTNTLKNMASYITGLKPSELVTRVGRVQIYNKIKKL